ncbi:MAG: hypothetical protein NTW50_04560 [Candidatus Berkelbacteria bacterium]|nr:hypothetical protein [Candidatus Berkelbacteria bacterium]
MSNLKELHHWDVMVLSCIDGRFVKRVVDWVATQQNDVFDYRTEVGCSKAIIDSGIDRERFFSAVDVAKRLHSIKEIWLVDHIDCGAYGGSKEQTSAESEREFHRNKLIEAQKIVSLKYPELNVKMIYASWDEIEVI